VKPLPRHLLTVVPGFALVLAICLLALASCRQSGAEAQAERVRFELVSPVFPPTLGRSALVFRLVDAAGEPITDADLYLTAAMDHKGSMASMIMTARADQDGLYAIPVEWPMSGEWLLTADATLADGSRESHVFELQVTGADDACDVPEAKGTDE
jgi:hypothetical protein